MSRKKDPVYCRMLGLVLLIFLGISANAKADNQLLLGEESVKLNLGVFIVDFRTGGEVTVDTDGGSGNGSVNLEDDLGFDTNQSVFRADGWWRFAPRHRLLAGHYAFGRDSSKTLEEDIEWKDLVFLQGTEARLEFEWQVTPVSYAYSFYQHDDWELSGSLGIHWVELGLAISGTIKEASGGTLTRYESSSVSGPLPNLGLHLDYQPSANWLLGANLQVFSLTYDEFDGTMIDINLYAEYLMTRNWALGLGYNNFDIDVGIDSDDWDGNIDLDYGGLQAYLSLRF